MIFTWLSTINTAWLPSNSGAGDLDENPSESLFENKGFIT